MRRSWEWFQARATSGHAQAWLVVLAFSESSFFLVPPDVLLIALLAARAGRWAYLAALSSLGSITGAIFGYALGAYVFEPIARPIIEFYHLSAEFAYVGTLYDGSTFWVVLAAAFTPIPFKVFVLSGGFFGVPFAPFLIASILGRSARFFLVAWLAHRYGPRGAELFLRYFKQVTIVASLMIVGLAAYYFRFPSFLF
jgi:membrane protein YqaA with SNARE-associated domain